MSVSFGGAKWQEAGCSTYLEADRGRQSAPEVHKVLAAVAQCQS